MRASVLLADDDVRLSDSMSEYLGREGYLITTVCEGDAVPKLLAERKFDAVILDTTLPGKSGFEVLRDLHGGNYPPTILISGCREEMDRLLGYELGADHYLLKPFQRRELLVLLNALLRRAKLNDRPVSNALGNFMICELSRQAFVDGAPVALTATEYRILERLVRYQGDPQSRELLCEKVLGRRCMPGDRSVDTHVSNLRRKLRDAGACGLRILSERHRGYSVVPR